MLKVRKPSTSPSAMAWSASWWTWLWLTLLWTGSEGGKHYADMSSSESEWPSEDKPERGEDEDESQTPSGRLLWAPGSHMGEETHEAALSELGQALENFGVPVEVRGGGADLAALLYDGRPLRGRARESVAVSYYPSGLTRMGRPAGGAENGRPLEGQPQPHRENQESWDEQNVARDPDEENEHEARPVRGEHAGGDRLSRGHENPETRPRGGQYSQDARPHREQRAPRHPDHRDLPGGGQSSRDARPHGEQKEPRHGDHRDLPGSPPCDPAHGGGGEFETQMGTHPDLPGAQCEGDPVHPVADDPWEEGRDALDVYSEDSRLAQEDGHNEEVDDDVITGIIGDLAGVDVDGEWISVNQLLEEFARGGNIPWIPINELLKQAEAQFRMIRREQRALLNSASAGKVRRWGEWRPGTDRWHNLDGSKRENVASSSASGSSDPGQSSDDLSNRGETSADLNHEDATDKSAHREAGFWRYGEWQDRPRSWTEQRWMAGGQGKVRQDKRAARIEQWAKGEWVPSWLRQYRVDKEARQRSSSTTGASSSQEPHRQLPDDDLPPVPEEDFDNTGLLQGRLQWTPAGEESDESTFMERPGLQGGEINALVDRGISGDLVRRFERVMRRYEHYLSNEQGPEARWMLGRWLQMSQWGADIQDDAEEPIRRRAQDPCVFPLRREPSDTLRGELQEWVGELTEVMAEIWTHGVRSATPGTLRDLDAHPAVATASGSRGRSRSPARRPLPPREDEGDITNLMDYGGYGSSGGADEPENDEEHVPPNEETVEDGAAASESAGGVGPILTGGDLPSMLGPVGAEALEPPDTRMSELLDRELEHAEQAYLIEVAVREAMYRPSAGTSREVVRRLLQCSQHDSEIQYWLQKALQQALRSCPPGREGGDMSNWREAVEYEGVIWQRVVGLTADDRMVRRLREVVQQRLQRRAERLAELDARTWTGSSGDTRPGPYAGGGTRNRPPWRRDPASGRGNTRGAGGLRDARPSLAPHLLPRGSPETLPGRRRSLHAAALRHGGSHVADPSHPAVDPPPASGPTRDVHVAVGPTEDDEPTVEDVQTCEGEPDADAPVDAGVVGLPLAEHAAVNPVEEPVPGGALAGEGGLRGAVVSTGENDDLVDSDESVNIE